MIGLQCREGEREGEREREGGKEREREGGKEREREMLISNVGD